MSTPANSPQYPPTDGPDTGAFEQKTHFLRLAKILMYVAMALCLWGLFYPQPFEWAMSALAVMPWLAVLVAQRSRGLLRVDEQKRYNPHPNVSTPFLLPGVVLTIEAFRFHTVDWQKLLWVSLLIAVLLLAAGTAADARLRHRKGKLLLTLLFTSAYGFGTATIGNALFDRSSPISYPTKVLEKHTAHGRSGTTYYLSLAPWGPENQSGEVSVPGSLYSWVATGDAVCVEQHHGAFGIRWFQVEGCR